MIYIVGKIIMVNREMLIQKPNNNPIVVTSNIIYEQLKKILGVVIVESTEEWEFLKN